jgi:hypothetical protein
MAEGDSSLGEIVWGEFQGHFVAGEDADAVAAKASGKVGQDDPVMIELYAEETTGKFF